MSHNRTHAHNDARTRTRTRRHARPTAQPLEDIVRRLTDDGRLIIGFLVSTMCGDIPDVTPSHSLQAARMLIKLGFSDAQLPDDSSSNAPAQTDLREQRPRTKARRSKLDAELARFARDETDGGRNAIRFLVDVMQGNVPDFKPCHRLAAAKELLRRGFDRHAGPDDQSEQDADPQSEHEHDSEPQPEVPEVPEGFEIDPDGSIGVDVFSRNHAIIPIDVLFGQKPYREWLRERKAEGRTILRPDWWQDGLEEFVDEYSLTLREAILEAAEAQGITVEPHLLPEDTPGPMPSPNRSRSLNTKPLTKKRPSLSRKTSPKKNLSPKSSPKKTPKCRGPSPATTTATS